MAQRMVFDAGAPQDTPETNLLNFPVNFSPRSCVSTALRWWSSASNDGGREHPVSQGAADHDTFTVGARMRSERYEVVCPIGESSCSATRASRVPASDCRTVFSDSDRERSECGEYRFALRRLAVPAANVTSASSLRELRKPGVTQMTPGFLFCRRQTARHRIGLVAEMV